MRTHVAHHLAYAPKQPGVIQLRLAHGDAVLTQLTSLPDQPGGMGEHSHWNRSVVICRTAELPAGDQRSPRTQVRGTDGCDHACRSSSDYEDVRHLYSPRIDFFAFSAAFNAVSP
jgi:hypothetical protein